MASPKFCSNCGAALSDSAGFCPSCGTMVNTVASPTVPSTTTPPSRGSSATKIIFIVIASIVGFFAVLIAAFILFLLVFLGGMSDAAQNEIAAIREGDINKAYSYTSIDFQKSVSKAEFLTFITHYPQIKNSKEASFPTRERDNEIGTLKGTLTNETGEKTAIQVKVIKENNTWKIFSIDIWPGKSKVPDTEDSSASDDNKNNTSEKTSDTTTPSTKPVESDTTAPNAKPIAPAPIANPPATNTTTPSPDSSATEPDAS